MTYILAVHKASKYTKQTIGKDFYCQIYPSYHYSIKISLYSSQKYWQHYEECQYNVLNQSNFFYLVLQDSGASTVFWAQGFCGGTRSLWKKFLTKFFACPHVSQITIHAKGGQIVRNLAEFLTYKFSPRSSEIIAFLSTCMQVKLKNWI